MVWFILDDEDVDEGLVEVDEDVEEGWLAVEVVFGIAV